MRFRNKIFTIVGIAAFTLVVAFNIKVVLNSNNAKIDVTMAYVEALAYELDEVEIICSMYPLSPGLCHYDLNPWYLPKNCGFSGYPEDSCYYD